MLTLRALCPLGLNLMPTPIRLLPAALIALRAALGPAIIAAVLASAPRYTVILLAAVGFLSDVADGIVARRIGIATERLRVADSRADACFYVGAAVAAWLAEPAIVHELRIPLLLLLVMQI